MDEMVVIWSEIAVNQRDEIFEFWNNHNKSTLYSEKLNRIIQEKIEQIKVFPNSGIRFKNSQIRMIHFENFSLIYHKIERTIYIYSFWDNRQSPDRILTVLKSLRK